MIANLFVFIWRFSARSQIIILAMTLASLPLLYLSLELPKLIINEALALPAAPRDFFGMEVAAIPFLVLLCLIFLGLVLANGALKMVINTRVGRVGEQMVRRLRYDLIQRMLGFPLPHFARLSQGEVIAAVTAETEPLAGFIGDSIALPVLQGGTMLTILTFLFVQDPILGAASVALIPIQAWLIPKMQKRINALGKERVRLVRRLSERIGEGVSGVREVRLHGTQRRTLAEFNHWLGQIYRVRLEIFQRKFFMKFVNNLLGQITPFLFFLIGGILVLNGSLTLGALVAALTAYKDLSAPWKELLNYYQRQADARLKYGQIVEQFSPEGAVPALAGPAQIVPAGDGAAVPPTHAQVPVVLDKVDPGAGSKPLHSRARGPLAVTGLAANNSSGERIFQGVSFTVQPGTSVAVLAENPTARERLAQVMTHLVRPDAGQVKIGDQLLAEMDSNTLGLSVAYVGPDPVMFAGTIYDNAVHALRRAPPTVEDRAAVVEALAAGATPDPFEGEWIDPSVIGQSDMDAVNAYWMQVLDVIGAADVVYRRGLLEWIDPSTRPEFSASLLEARRRLTEECRKPQEMTVIHRLNPGTFNPAFSLGDNLLFGTAADDRLAGRGISSDDYMGHVMTKSGLREHLQALSTTLSIRVAEIAAAGSRATEIFAFLDEAAVEELERLTPFVANREFGQLRPDDRRFLGWLMFNQIPSKHRLGVITAGMKEAILRARQIFKEDLPADYRDAVIPFDENQVHPDLTVTENILYGRVAEEVPEAEQRARALVDQTVDGLGLRRDIMLLLSESQVGIGGSRVPPVARHRIGLIRGLMKQPSLVVFQDALGPLGREAQADALKRLRALLPETMVVWIDDTVEGLPPFDETIQVTRDGVISVEGPMSELPSVATDSMADGGPDGTAGDNLREEVARLARIPVFAGLPEQALTLIAATADRITVDEGDSLYVTGQEADGAYVSLGARLALWRPAKDNSLQRIVTVSKTEMIGEIETIAEIPRVGQLVAETPGAVLRLDTGVLNDLLSHNPEMAVRMMQGIGRRFSRPPEPAKPMR